MTGHEFTLVVNRTPLTRPLLDGEATAEGFNLRVLQSQSIDDTSRRMLDLEYDVGEVSIGTFIRARDRGVPLVALPIFTNSRQFLNANLQVAARLGMRDLSELRDRTIGAPQYWTASSLWQREFLRDQAGLEATDLSWVTFQPERMEGLEVPAGVRHRLETNRTPQQLAEAGELDAFTTAAGRRQEEEGASPPALVPFFQDRAAAQREYFQRTGIYPLQYVNVMPEELAEREPRLVESVCDAFVRAKAIAQAREPLASPEMIELLGDPWPYGLSANRKTLEAFVDAAHRQGATARRFTVDEIFARNLPDSMK